MHTRSSKQIHRRIRSICKLCKYFIRCSEQSTNFFRLLEIQGGEVNDNVTPDMQFLTVGNWISVNSHR